MLAMQPSPYFGCTFQPMFNCVCFPQAYLIISLIWQMLSPCHIIVEIHLLEISVNCRWVHQLPPLPLLDLMMNPCFRALLLDAISRESSMSSRQFVSHLFSSSIVSLRYHDTNRIWISVRYDGWNIFPRVITLVFIWPCKVMSCLAHLAGGPIVIDSFSARLSILPWGNCKTYSTSCSWWILCVARVWPLLENHVNAISKHVCGTPIFNKNIWSPMLNVSCSIIQIPLYGWCHEISLPLPKEFSTLYHVMDIMLCLSLERI